jgi:tetratricopeptide (TPR) repeat protein
MNNPHKNSLEFYTNESDSDSPGFTLQGFFSAPQTKAWLSLYDSLDAAQQSTKTCRAYLNKIDRLIDKEPDFLDAYNEAGWTFLELAPRQDSPEAFLNITFAQDYFARAFKRAKALIPPEFAGKILWGNQDNRPFFRSHSGLIQCLLRKKQHADAAQMIEEHLAWNPNDNIGVRYQLGDAYLLSGDTAKARSAYAACMSDDMAIYPANAYSLGLLEFREGNYSAAATALRNGFISNVYIAEILTGRTVEKPHFIWHGSSDASVRAAKNYLIDQGMLDYWKEALQAIDFVDWLFNCAKVLRERLEWAEIREGLTYEHDIAARSPYVSRGEQLRKKIAKVTMLIQKVTDHRGENRWPWEHGRTDLFIEQY